MAIEDVADELYGLPPDEFTAARNARAAELAAAGDRDLGAAVKRLRKPSVGAWLLNLLVREDRDEVEHVLELGERLRAAQGTLRPPELRTLDEQRRALTRAVARNAGALGERAGRSASASALTAVEESLRSAMVDPAAGAALASGRLVDTFSSTGLDPVDLSRVLAVGDGEAAPRPVRRTAARSEPDAAQVAAARASLDEAEGAARQAQDDADDARRRSAEAGRRRTERTAELDEARRRVASLEEQVGAAEEAEQEARRTQLAATRAERAAVEAVEQARRRLADLDDA